MSKFQEKVNKYFKEYGVQVYPQPTFTKQFITQGGFNYCLSIEDGKPMNPYNGKTVILFKDSCNNQEEEIENVRYLESYEMFPSHMCYGILEELGFDMEPILSNLDEIIKSYIGMLGGNDNE